MSELNKDNHLDQCVPGFERMKPGLLSWEVDSNALIQSIKSKTKQIAADRVPDAQRRPKWCILKKRFLN